MPRGTLTLATGGLVILLACSPTEPYRDLGVLQVRVLDTSVPQSLASSDTLRTVLVGRPDAGDCFTFSHADIDRTAAHVALTLWAEARQWQGAGPPPPCGVVDYRYVGLPPFAPGWFLVIANQPQGGQRADSIQILP